MTSRQRLILCCTAGATGVALALAAAALNHSLRHSSYNPSIAAAIAFPGVGSLLAFKRPANSLGWVFLVVGLTQGIDEFVAPLAVVIRPAPGWDVLFWFGTWLWIPGLGLLMTFVILLFPTGHLPSTRWMWVARVAGVSIALATVDVAVSSWPYRGHPLGAVATTLPGFRVLIVVALIVNACMVAAVASLVLRFWRSRGDERQQMKWFTVSAAVLMIGVIHANVFPVGPAWIDQILTPLAVASVPAAMAVAILRYRLYDIDVVINRALVYGVLAALITLVYVAIVVGAGEVLGTGGRPNVLLSILATAVVAVAFQPARETLQKLANRLVYGARATPYEALADFSRQLSGAVSTDDVLPRVAEAAGTALGVRWTAAALVLPDGSSRTAEWGTHHGVYSETVEVRHEGEMLGHIAFVSDEPFSGATLQVASNFANQAGAVFRNLRLTAELQGKLDAISQLTEQLGASRQRIVAAAEDERRRLELEISRSTKRQLAEIRAALRASRVLLEERDEAAAVEALQQLSARASEALDGLRELARGVFPPLLVDKGVVAALEAHARRSGRAQLDFDEGMSSERFAPAVEAALYFSCLEALRGAADARVRLREHGDWVECRIDPLGAQASTLNIQDRIEALGGMVDLDSGKSLELRLPVRAAEVIPPLG